MLIASNLPPYPLNRRQIYGSAAVNLTSNCVVVVKFEPKILNIKNGISTRAFQICSFSYKKSPNFILLSDLNTKFNLNAIKLSLLVKFDKEKYANTKRRPRLGRYLALQGVRYLREPLSCGRAGDGRRAARCAR